MSEQNVEVVRDSFDAWNRGDRDAWMVGSHAEIELSSAIQRQVEGVGAIHRGKAGMVQFWNEWHTAWRDSKIEITETRDLGDTVLALFRFRAQGIVSGAPVDMAGGWLFQFEDGLIRRAWAYSTPEQALEAAGLSE